MLLSVNDSTTGASIGVIERRLEIREISRNALATSSLVVADMLDEGSSLNSWFHIGNLRVRPSLSGRFHPDRVLGIFQQIYPARSGPLNLETVISTNGREFKRISEELPTAPEMAVVKRIPLSDFPSGNYEIQTTITDQATGQTAVSKAQFTVE